MEQAENAARLQQLISAYQSELMRVCYFYLKDRMLAEDAVQETFMRVWRKLDSYQDKGQEKAWLYRIAINCCRDTQRTGWFRRVLPTGEPQLFPKENVALSEDDIVLNMTIHNLPLRLKEVVLLYYYQNFTVSEIAGILHVTQPAVSERLKRAREKLRAALKEDSFNE